MTQNISSQEQPNEPKEAVFLGADLEPWNREVAALIAEGAQIITFRGAGTVNGIEPAAAGEMVRRLNMYVETITSGGRTVALMYDGDGDNRERPDVGSVFGTLVDSLSGNPRVRAIAAQTQGWYNPTVERGPIMSATGKAYETYVFDDGLPGAHESLTQSEALVAYPGYEQVIVGSAGPIALRQLADLSHKASNRSTEAEPMHVTVYEAPLNPAVEVDLQTKLVATTDEQVRANTTAKLEQRHNQPYGALFTPDGRFAVDEAQFPGISFSVVRTNP